MSSTHVSTNATRAKRRLGDIAMIVMGQSPPSSTYHDHEDGPPFLQGKGEFGTISPSPTKWCSSPVRLAPKGSILLSVRAPVGDVNLADREYCIGRGLAAIACGDECDSEYIFNALIHAKPRLEAEGSGTTFHSVNRGTLDNFEIDLPPITEQRAVGSILKATRQAQDVNETVIEALRTLKRTAMGHLFSFGPVLLQNGAHIELANTTIGAIPKHWGVARLGDLAKVGNGSTPKRDKASYWEGGNLPWLTSGKIHDEFITQADQFVTSDAARECHLPLVTADSVVVAITGQGKTLGNAALVGFDTFVSQHLAYIHLNDNADMTPEFLLRFLQLRYSALRSVAGAGGSTKGALTCAFLRSYLVPLPPPDEQNRIVSILRSIDLKLKAHRRRRAGLEAVFKSALAELMSGRRRLQPLEASSG